MRRVRVVLALLAFLVTLTLGIALSSRLVPSEDRAGDVPPEENSVESRIRRLQDSGIVAFSRWGSEDNLDRGLTCIVRRLNQDSCYPGEGVKFSVINQARTSIYDECFTDVLRIYPVYALRNTEFPQLALEVTYGGGDAFLEILDYQDGKVVALTKSISKESQFASGVEVRPQFRSGVNPSQEAYQILLTNPSLAGPGEKFTTVFRYKDGAYKRVGEFSQQKVDNYIEQLMIANRSKR